MDIHLDGIERKLERLEAAAAAEETVITMSCGFRLAGEDDGRPTLEVVEGDACDTVIVRLRWPEELDG